MQVRVQVPPGAQNESGERERSAFGLSPLSFSLFFCSISCSECYVIRATFFMRKRDACRIVDLSGKPRPVVYGLPTIHFVFLLSFLLQQAG